MASTLQLVDTDLSTVLFDFNDSTGAANPNGVKTMFGVGGSLAFGANSPEVVVVSPTSMPGGDVVYRRDPLGQMVWSQRFFGVTYDNLAEAVGILSNRLAAGGTLKFIPHGASATRYIDFEPSATPLLLDGRELGLFQLLQLNDTPEGVPISLTVQPYMRGAELLASGNKVTNGTLIHDFGGTANRPDNWTWSATTGLSAESIASGLDWGYKFTKADGAAVSLQQTTATGSFASGDVVTFSFYAKVDAVAGTPQMQATVQFKQSDGTTNVGSLHSGGLVTLTTSWQRISVTTSAAGALTSRAQVSIQQDNADATSVVCRVRNAQAEVASSAQGFRVGPEAVNFDPASTSLPRRVAVYAPGTAPTTGRLTFTADAATLGEVSVYRETREPVQMLQQTGHKQLESGTLGSGTTSVADGNASAGNTAEVDYPATTITLDADASGDISSSSSIVVSKPASTNEGDLMLVAFHISAASHGATPITSTPSNWIGAGVMQETALSFKPILALYYKIAGPSEPSTYTWTLSENNVGRWWAGTYSLVDGANPIDAVTMQSNGTSNSTTVNIASVTTSRDNNRVIAFSAGFNTTGSFTVTPPAGSTPTYTEQEDGMVTNGSLRVGLEVADGNLATAGATGAKTTTMSVTGTSLSAHLVLNTIPALFEERVRQTWTVLRPGDYDVWLRFYPTAASVQRLEVEWAPVASPSTWYSMGQFVIDTSTASSFAYAYRKVGRIHIPDEWALDTLTIRISAGLDEASTANLRLDFLDLVPINETASTLTSPGTVASGAKLVGDPDAARTFHLDSTSELVAVGTASGAIPIPLEPGLNMLTIVSRQVAATGFDDRAAVLTAAPTFQLDVTPRYR